MCMMAMDKAAIDLAESVFQRALPCLPGWFVKKLETRRMTKGNIVNRIRVYDQPVMNYQAKEAHLEQLCLWGKTYGDILERIAEHYQNHECSFCRSFLENALVRYFPVHLNALIENYKTSDPLAGAHLGDDNIMGKSIEWNLGAVGGLDEGFYVQERINTKHTVCPYRSKDPVDVIIRSLFCSFNAFCRGSGVKPVDSPLIAFVEVYDIYGSFVRICSRFGRKNLRTCLCFDKELVYKNRVLSIRDGEKIDVVYLNGHLESLEHDHPLIRALSDNSVCLDTSPLARLVLRSKVVMALLSEKKALDELALNFQEKEMVRHHLVPTQVWSKHFFSAPPGTSKTLVKIASGAVFGGDQVAVINGEKDLFAAAVSLKIVQELMRQNSLTHLKMDRNTLYNMVKTDIKALLKDMVIQKHAREMINRKNVSRKTAYQRAAGNVKGRHIGADIARFFLNLRNRLKQLPMVGFCDIQDVLAQEVENFFSSAGISGNADNQIPRDADDEISGNADYEIPGNTDNQISGNADYEIPGNTDNQISGNVDNEISQVIEVVKTAYVKKQCTQTCPVVFQPWIEPETVNSSNGLYLMNRTHVLFTDQGKEVFIAGSQVFSLKNFKHDNTTKSTAFLCRQR